MSLKEQKDSPPDEGTLEVSDASAEPAVESYRQLCSHYTRGCSFVSPCCGKVYPCRLCHNEKEVTHEIDRYKVAEVVCRKCESRQPVSGSCSECGISFGRYYCSVCHLYADEDKQQFHCEKCGLCRVGGRDNFFHCDTCGYCLSVSVESAHHCRRQASRDNCPVCMEDLHTSRSAIQPTDCGHLLHAICYKEMLQKGLYQCPQCQCSIVDMNSVWKKHDQEKQEWQMPQHLRNFKVKVQCRDCRKESDTDFHIVGFKCGSCGSYNTVRCGNEEIPEDDGGQGGGGAANMLLEMLRIFRAARRQRREEDEQDSTEEDSDEENAPAESEDGSDGAPNDDRNSPPVEPPADNQSYDGDQSNVESVENSPPSPAPEGLQVEPQSSQTASLHVEPGLDQATAGLRAESESDQATARGEFNSTEPLRAAAGWYGHESSSEREWPMAPPLALNPSDWSNSFTQSDSHSLNSDSSWETVEMEVIIGESPNDLPPNEPQQEPEGENWDNELGDSGTAETMVTGSLNLATSSGPLRNNNAYNAHIRLDQNGTTSDDSQPWDTANDESAPDEPLPTHT